MRKRARLDGNHTEIVSALREAGASVASLASLGKGRPDILVGWKHRNFLFEIKDPTQKPSKRVLTQEEKDWHVVWCGQISVIETAEQAFAIMEGKCS